MYRGQLELDDIQPVIYMFLPLAHVLARIAQIVVLDVGGTLAYWRGDPERILEEVAETSSRRTSWPCRASTRRCTPAS